MQCIIIILFKTTRQIGKGTGKGMELRFGIVGGGGGYIGDVHRHGIDGDKRLSL